MEPKNYWSYSSFDVSDNKYCGNVTIIPPKESREGDYLICEDGWNHKSYKLIPIAVWKMKKLKMYGAVHHISR